MFLSYHIVCKLIKHSGAETVGHKDIRKQQKRVPQCVKAARASIRTLKKDFKTLKHTFIPEEKFVYMRNLAKM